MADTKISALTHTSGMASTDRIPSAYSPFASGNNAYWTPTDLATLIFASPTFTGVTNVPVGSSAAPSLSIGNATTGLYSVSTTGFGISVNGTLQLDFGITHASAWTLNAGTLFLPGAILANGSISTGSNAAVFQLGASNDIVLARDAAGILAQRNSTNAQSFKVYNTYTDASNYERGIFDWQGSSNVLTIGTEAAGTGSTRNLRFIVGGTNKLDYNVTNTGWTFATTLNVSGGASLTGSVHIGASSTFDWTSRSSLTAPADGQFLFQVNAQTNGFTLVAGSVANLIGIGGSTASFPALKRSSATLQVRLADDSAFAAFELGAPKFSGVNTTGAGAALLGSNSPSAHLSSPYTWIDVTAADGTACTMPIWQK